MQHIEIRRRLKDLAKAITDQIEYPNNGGCAVIAYIVGEALASFGVMVEVVTPINDDYGLEHINIPKRIRKEVNNSLDARDWVRNGLILWHLAVRFRFDRHSQIYTWDSDGLRMGASQFGQREYITSKFFGEGLTIEEVKAFAADASGWNQTFDRGQIPKIKAIVQSILIEGHNYKEGKGVLIWEDEMIAA